MSSNMTLRTPLAALQKTYDDCHLVCSTAVYFESRADEAEALRCWKNALEQIAYHNVYRVPSAYVPKSQTEKALQASLRDMELQCRERVELLEALRESRKEVAESGGAKSGKLVKERDDGGVDSKGGLGMGTLPPLGYPDLVRPPPLPTRPMPSMPVMSTDRFPARSAAETERLEEARLRVGAVSPLAPLHRPNSGSRSSSPEKKFRLKKKTLRPSSGPRKASSSPAPAASSQSSFKYQNAAKAATQAWTSKPEQRRTRSYEGEPESYNTGDDDSSRKHSERYGMNVAIRVKQQQDDRQQSDSSTTRELDKGRRRTREPYTTTQSSTNTNSQISMKPYTPLRGKGTSQGPSTTGKLPAKVSTTDQAPYSSPIRRSSPAISRKPISRTPHSPQSSRQTTRRRPPIETPSESSEDEEDEEDNVDAAYELGCEAEELEKDVEELTWLDTTTKLLANPPRGVDAHAAEQILNEIVIHGDDVRWTDIAGLEIAKTALKENVVYPFLRPDLFRGLREPARGILLFGPPGTGKTMLARAVAAESKSTFFAISASSLTSKFLGESEKLVRALFALAKALAPSVIFVDEIDSLLSSRSDSGEHETSRRIKTEFLIQWSDLARAAAGRESVSKKSSSPSSSATPTAVQGDASRVLVLAATNAPWAIDEAARRRFVRRQYIPLPESEVRKEQLNHLMAEQRHGLSEEDVDRLVQMTDGFSGSDMTALAKDAAMGPLRSLGDKLLMTRMDEIRPILFDDFVSSLQTIRPSVSKQGLQQFEDWAKEYGERGG